MIEIIDNNEITNIKDKIEPNFIYNRADLTGDKYFMICINNGNEKKYIEVSMKDNYVELGAWLMELSNDNVKDISSLIFRKYKSIKYVSYKNLIQKNQHCKKNFFYLALPISYYEIEQELSSKSRQRLRRNKRDLDEKYGKMQLVDYCKNIPNQIVEEFFKLKKETLNIEYNLSPEEYILKYHVSNAYVLSVGKRIAAIFFTCEQCPIAYGENFAYNNEFSYYSPGIIIYDLIIKSLIEKKKKMFFLGGGNYEYKKKYNSTEIMVSDGIIYRNTYYTIKYKVIDIYNKHIFWKLVWIKNKIYKISRMQLEP